MNIAPNFERLFDAIPGSCLALLPDLTIVSANDAYVKSTLKKKDDIIGRGAV